jgi:hypothetical protein
MTYVPDPSTKTENFARGTVFALAVIPLGIVAWVLLWNVGFIASIVGFAVAWAAVRLYLLGSGGLVSRNGAIRISIITIGTLLLAILGGLVSDVIPIYSRVANVSWIEALFSANFWTVFQQVQGRPGGLSDELPSILIGIGLGALGCYSILRNAFRATSKPKVATETLAPPIPTPEATPTAIPGATSEATPDSEIPPAPNA